MTCFDIHNISCFYLLLPDDEEPEDEPDEEPEDEEPEE